MGLRDWIISGVASLKLLMNKGRDKSVYAAAQIPENIPMQIVIKASVETGESVCRHRMNPQYPYINSGIDAIAIECVKW